MGGGRGVWPAGGRLGRATERKSKSGHWAVWGAQRCGSRCQLRPRRPGMYPRMPLLPEWLSLSGAGL